MDSDIPGKFFAAYTVKGSEVIDLMCTTSFFNISNKLNLKRNSPSILTDKSPNTKKPPSLLSMSFNLCRDETNVPANAWCGGIGEGESCIEL